MIEVEHLTKRYGETTAVSDLSFTITPGQIYGFLGPNGAGKSTTMNIMAGCLAATSGEVKIGGYDIFEQPKEAKKQVGYLPEFPPLYMDQTVTEYLRFVAKAKGLPRREVDQGIGKVVEETRLEEVKDRVIKHLSKGYRQRVGIAQALLGNPEIIILDEPTVGLDPAQIIEIRDLIRTLGENHTVIFSSHILSEVQAICDEVLIIHKGRLVAFDRPERLSQTLSSGNSVELCCETSAEEMKMMLAGIQEISSVTVKEETEKVCSAVLAVGEENPKEVCRKIYLIFMEKGAVLQQLNPVRPTLEEIFIQITSEPEEGIQATAEESSSGQTEEDKIPQDPGEEDPSEENDDSGEVDE